MLAALPAITGIIAVMDITITAITVTVIVVLFALAVIGLIRFFFRSTHTGGPTKRELAENRAEIEEWRRQFPRRD